MRNTQLNAGLLLYLILWMMVSQIYSVLFKMKDI